MNAHNNDIEFEMGVGTIVCQHGQDDRKDVKYNIIATRLKFQYPQI